QKRLLRHVTNTRAQLRQRVIANINIIDKHRARRRFNQTRNQIRNRRLPTPRASDKRNSATLGNRERQIFQHRLVIVMVTKRQIAKLNLSLDRRLLNRTWLIGNRRLDAQDGVESLQARGTALIKIHDVSERDQRPDQSREIQIEHRELTNRDLAAHRE